MDIYISRLEYQFDNQGNVTCVNGVFNASQSEEYLNARVCIRQENLPEGQTFDDMTRKQLDALCRQKLSDMTAVDDEKQTE